MLPFGTGAVPGSADFKAVSVGGKFCEYVTQKRRVKILLLTVYQDGDDITACIIGQSGGVRAAALPAGNNPLSVQESQGGSYGLPADMMLSAQFRFCGQPGNAFLQVMADLFCKKSGQRFIFIHKQSYVPFCPDRSVNSFIFLFAAVRKITECSQFVHKKYDFYS